MKLFLALLIVLGLAYPPALMATFALANVDNPTERAIAFLGSTSGMLVWTIFTIVIALLVSLFVRAILAREERT